VYRPWGSDSCPALLRFRIFDYSGVLFLTVLRNGLDAYTVNQSRFMMHCASTPKVCQFIDSEKEEQHFIDTIQWVERIGQALKMFLLLSGRGNLRRQGSIFAGHNGMIFAAFLYLNGNCCCCFEMGITIGRVEWTIMRLTTGEVL